MPPHLHPRSMATSTLFAGTLLASFVVVGIPHLFPCPRPRRGYADTERPPPQQLDEHGQRRVQRRGRSDETEAYSNRETQRQLSPQQDSKTTSTTTTTSGLQRKSLAPSQRRDMAEEAALFAELQREAEALEREARECPVPKPKGFIGRILGFDDQEKAAATSHPQSQSPPPAPSIPSQAIGSGGSGGRGRS